MRVFVTKIRRQSFSLIELLITIAIIAILAGILLPALNSARERAIAVNCTGNLRQIGHFLHSYTDDNRDWGPQMFDDHFLLNGSEITQVWQNRLMYYYMPDVPVSNLHHVITTEEEKRKIRPIFACPSHNNTEFPRNEVQYIWRHYGMNEHMGGAVEKKFHTGIQREASVPSAQTFRKSLDWRLGTKYQNAGNTGSAPYRHRRSA